MPSVERPPLRPPIVRQGQIASQLQASRYVPEIRQGRNSDSASAVTRASLSGYPRPAAAPSAISLANSYSAVSA